MVLCCCCVLLCIVVGGGLYGEWTSASITGLVVSSCVATSAGGCVAFRKSAGRLTKLDLSGCSAVNGGGVSLAEGSAVEFADSLIALNTGANGAGVYIDASSLAGVNTHVANNSATVAGGGAFLGGSKCTLSGISIQKCFAPLGGGVATLNAQQTRLMDLDITNNEATGSGGGIHASASTLSITTVSAASNTAVSGGGLCASASTISGTLTLGSNHAAHGGGAVSSGTTTLEGTLIEFNTAAIGGGGIYAGDGELTLRDLEIASCSSVNGIGGGVYLVNTQVVHDQAVVRSCSATVGGGLYVESSSFTASREEDRSMVAKFVGNEASSLGGGIFVSGADSLVKAFSISAGSAQVNGGGIASENAARCTISNGVIQNSTAVRFGGGAFFGMNATCAFKDSVVERNSASQSGGGIAVQHASLRHSNLVVRLNGAKTGGGLYVSSLTKDLPVAATRSSDRGAERSILDSNFVVSESENGANALIDCGGVCELAGFLVTRGVIKSGKGGGLFILGKGTTRLAEISAENNEAQTGGGVSIHGANKTVITSSSFTGNVAHTGGAGLSVESAGGVSSSVEVSESALYNNTAVESGGAVLLDGSSLIATSLLVLENRATHNESGIGGGVYARSLSTLQVSGSLLLHNRALCGGSIAVDAESEATIDDSSVTGDSKRFTSDWDTLFTQLVGAGGARYQSERANQDFNVTVQRGHLVFISGENTMLNLTRSFLTYGSAESGGGASVESSAVMHATHSAFLDNYAKESGGSVFVTGSGAEVHLESSQISSSGK